MAIIFSYKSWTNLQKKPRFARINSTGFLLSEISLYYTAIIPGFAFDRCLSKFYEGFQNLSKIPILAS